MPSTSKAQFRFMKAMAGKAKNRPEGLSQKEAKEYTQGQTNYKDLPEKSNRYKKLKEAMRKK